MPATTLVQKLAHGALVVVVTLLLTAVAGEILLRIKNSDQRSYTIEMWRYARELKQISPDPALGHIHVPNRLARLQGTDIQINDLGLRGPALDLSDRSRKRALLLGSSITLGWGVAEQQTTRARLEHYLNGTFWAVNGGIGNYNVVRSVAFFGSHLRDRLKPDVVILHFFVGDAAYLPPSRDNYIFRNSQLAVLLYHIVQNFLQGSTDISALVRYYRDVYSEDGRSLKEMRASLRRLQEMQRTDGFEVVLAIIPDIHQLAAYPLMFVHDKMREIAAGFGWQTVDFLDDLKQFRGPELWAIPGDPHPNALVHDIMARRLARVLNSLN
jgi:hypothetical protein